jgi:hypothetical protein
MKWIYVAIKPLDEEGTSYLQCCPHLHSVEKRAIECAKTMQRKYGGQWAIIENEIPTAKEIRAATLTGRWDF